MIAGQPKPKIPHQGVTGHPRVLQWQKMSQLPGTCLSSPTSASRHVPPAVHLIIYLYRALPSTSSFIFIGACQAVLLMPFASYRFMKTASGVKIQELRVGSGTAAKQGDRVLLEYVLRRGNGYFIYRCMQLLPALVSV